VRPRRSCLTVPATSDKMLAKAARLDPDMVVLDLEDAVAPGEKTDETRARAVAALRDQDWAPPTRTVRVNAASTRWCFRDVVAVVEGAGAVLDSVVLPKVASAAHVQFLDLLLTELEDELGLDRRIALELQIETPLGLLAIEEIAAASSRAEALVFGPGDFAASLGVPQLTVGGIDTDYPGDQWHYVRMRIVTTARAFGLQAIDGPYAGVADVEGLRASARRAQLLGFDGKWVIHPDQIAICNEVYTPSPEQVARSERILAAYTAATHSGAGAVPHDGEMIDEASRKMAGQIAARARAAGRMRR
jgi:citrate lyase subunit beta / citryl-CoA lyase